MLLLGARPPGRHTEQHDFFFCIASSVAELVPHIKAFWRGAGSGLHVDGWREVNSADGFRIEVVPRNEAVPSTHTLFFVNLGGYQPGKLEEQHYTVLTVQEDKASAVRAAKQTLFFRHNTIKGTTANSHIDDQYGIDVDDLYNIEEMLLPAQKEQYTIRITPVETTLPEDEVHLGYFKLDKLTRMG
jgi:hypothetical protein